MLAYKLLNNMFLPNRKGQDSRALGVRTHPPLFLLCLILHGAKNRQTKLFQSQLSRVVKSQQIRVILRPQDLEKTERNQSFKSKENLKRNHPRLLESLRSQYQNLWTRNYQNRYSRTLQNRQFQNLHPHPLHQWLPLSPHPSLKTKELQELLP